MLHSFQIQQHEQLPSKYTMNGFVKLYGTILTSSIWLENHATLRVWIAMLASADWDGVVGASVGGLAHVSRVTKKECQTALDIFLAPDEDSRTPSNDGRRIEKVAGGWRILNHAAYRERRSNDERGEAASCYVYYAVDGDRVKIGSSKNPWARATRLKQELKRPNIKVAAVEQGGYELEFQRHAQFAADRIEGEWFRLSTAIEAHIGALPRRKAVATAVATPSDGEATVQLQQEAEADVEVVPPPPPARSNGAQSPNGSTAQSLVSVVPAEFRPDMQSLLDLIPNVTAWTAEMRSAIEGMHGKPLTAAQLGQAVRDYLASGKAKSSPSLRSFRRYMQGVLEVNGPTPLTFGKRKGPPEYDYTKTTDSPEAIKWAK